jgi:LmbE family N-acetylglucosaminyl deacetylase
MTSVLVIAPHPDDETLGCGGALRLHALAGDDVRIVYVTSGEQGGHGLSPAETAVVREAEAGRAAAVMGVHDLVFLRRRDGGLRSGRHLVEAVGQEVATASPDIVYAPHAGDAHPDHRAVARATTRALAESPEVDLLGYEIWTPVANIGFIVDISSVIDVKVAAVRAYVSQCRVMRFDDAFLGLARYRGEMHSWPGGPYAEVFTRVQR